MASNRFSLVLTHIVVAMALFVTRTKGGIVGMNCGRVAHQRLLPSMVVDLLLQNNISAAKIHTSEADLIKAFSNSGIRLSLGIYAYDAIASVEKARNWVNYRYEFFQPCNVRYIYIGNGMLKSNGGTRKEMKTAVDVLEYMSNAVNEVGYAEKTKVTLAMDQTNLMPSLSKPSEAEFMIEYKDEMVRLTNLLKANNAPFIVELFPISFVTTNNYDPEFAFIDNKSNFVITDVNGAVYRNAVEFLYDAFSWALMKINASDLKIVVGVIGWPTDGYPGANVANAERFYRSLLPWAVQNKGTPRHPQLSIDMYLHSLTDENKMPYKYPFSRHWGIYTSNGQPKYKIDLSGQGRDIFPTKAKGIMKMPRRWCVLDETATDVATMRSEFGYACDKSDCTSLAPGGSCSHLTFQQNVSYAFNKYFQFNFQKEDECNFKGLGKVVTDDPSVDRCIFPVEVVSPLPPANSVSATKYSRLFLFLLSLFWAFIWI